ncbi:MAG: hypothetical protein R3192_12305 [Woeseiaceae bacterium]|nr:hypothetical protein [Woeseiaceae bacterium]
MNNDKINQWLTTIANFGVIIGIIFLVIEIRQTSTQIEQNTVVLQAQTLESTVEVNAVIAEHSEIWLKGSNDEPLTNAEMVVMGRLVDSLYRRARYTSQMARTLGGVGSAQLRDFAILLYENPGARRTWESATEREVIYFAQMVPGDNFRRNYREEVLAELAKLDELEN